MLHIQSTFIHWNWRKISEEPHEIECLNFMFTGDSEWLCRHYNLTPEDFAEFRKVTRKPDFFLNCFMSIIIILQTSLCARCLEAALEEVSPILFMTLSLPMFLLSLYSYYHAIGVIYTFYQLKYIKEVFLSVRAKSYTREILHLPTKFTQMPILLKEIEYLRIKIERSKSKDHQQSLIIAIKEKYKKFLALEKNHSDLKAHLEEVVCDLIEQFKETSLLFVHELPPMHFFYPFCALLLPVCLIFDFQPAVLVGFYELFFTFKAATKAKL